MSVIQVAIISSFILSSSAGAWLMWRCAGITTLFGRQMFHLGFADMLGAVLPLLLAGSYELWARHLLDRQSGGHSAGDELFCSMFVLLINGFRILSALVELHIAMGLVAVLLRKARWILWLEASLGPLWVLAAILEAVDYAFTDTEPKPKLEILERCPNQSPVCGVCITVAVALSSGLYVVGMCKARQLLGNAARHRAAERVFLFPLNFLITFGLTSVYSFLPLDTKQKLTIKAPAFLLADLNGFINAVTYGLLDRGRLCASLCFWRSRPAAQSRRSVFPVAFLPGPSVSTVVLTSSVASEDSLANAAVAWPDAPPQGPYLWTDFGRAELADTGSRRPSAIGPPVRL